MLEYNFGCPHCWENQIKMIDPSIQNQQFIEDCETCCNPLEFRITINANLIECFEVSSIEQ